MANVTCSVQCPNNKYEYNVIIEFYTVIESILYVRIFAGIMTSCLFSAEDKPKTPTPVPPTPTPAPKTPTPAPRTPTPEEKFNGKITVMSVSW